MGVWLHTVMARPPTNDGPNSLTSILDDMEGTYQGLLGTLGLCKESTSSAVPYLVYADAEVATMPAAVTSATIPCRSIWSNSGLRLEIVGLYKVYLGV